MSKKKRNRKKGITQESINKINFHRNKLYKEAYEYFLTKSLPLLQKIAQLVIDKRRKLSVIRQIALRNAIMKKIYENILVKSEQDNIINEET